MILMARKRNKTHENGLNFNNIIRLHVTEEHLRDITLIAGNS